MHRKSKATIAAAIGTALALVGSSPATAVTLEQWSLLRSTQTATQLTSTSTVKPLVGDFNGDHRKDVFFYAPGASPDYLWTSKPFDPNRAAADQFSVTELSVSGTYTPLVGDFDGNGADDVFWYGPGTYADSVWYFEGGNVDEVVARSVSGTYAPVVADFDSEDGNQTDDIFWYSAKVASSLWSGTTTRTFSGRGFSAGPPLGAKVLLGNWTADPGLTDGSYHADLFFYVPGTGADAIWTGDGTGQFTPTAKTVRGTYNPVVGNFDRVDEVPPAGTPLPAPLTDVLWYAPGTASDSVWMNNGNGSFSPKEVPVSGTNWKPFVIPNILGGDTIMWNNPTGTDARWQTKGLTAFEYASTGWPGADMGTRTPLVGMFDDDCVALEALGPYGADVLWVQAGDTTAQKEVLWTGDDAGKWVPLQNELYVPPILEL